MAIKDTSPISTMQKIPTINVDAVTIIAARILNNDFTYLPPYYVPKMKGSTNCIIMLMIKTPATEKLNLFLFFFSFFPIFIRIPTKKTNKIKIRIA